jgi:hypothetical protein
MRSHSVGHEWDSDTDLVPDVDIDREPYVIEEKASPLCALLPQHWHFRRVSAVQNRSCDLA